jgi:hypothetical protein
MKKLSSILQILRHTGYVVIIGISLFWLVDNYYAGYTNWLILSIGLVSALQLFLRIRFVDVVLGYVCLLASLYMVLAVLSDYFHYLHGEHYSSTLTYFCTGFGIFITASVLSLSIILSHYYKTKKPASLQA